MIKFFDEVFMFELIDSLSVSRSQKSYHISKEYVTI